MTTVGLGTSAGTRRPRAGRTPPVVRVPPWTRRVLDVVGALVALAFLAPLLLAVAVLVRATSRGPVLHRQTRVGRDGRPITIWKFRTMCADADALLPALRVLTGAAGPRFAMVEDPRVTALGHWLRRWSLDDLPQLLNVLGGSMTLVGPRPALPAEVAPYDEAARRRTPGLIGSPAAVLGLPRGVVDPVVDGGRAGAGRGGEQERAGGGDADQQGGEGSSHGDNPSVRAVVGEHRYWNAAQWYGCGCVRARSLRARSSASRAGRPPFRWV
jgi:lipopolysaccharide/colanic/teichoic acid biosynthesis glycosyltransferase